MTIKKFSQTLECTISIEVKVLNTINSISKKLFLEAQAFRERNGIVAIASSLKDEKPIYKCCPSCLKAHLLKKAEEMNLGRAVREIIRNMATYETGHRGYYLDGGELIKV